MMRAMLAALVVATAACAPAQEAKEVAPVSNNAVPAPTPQDVTTRITAEQNGGRVEVAVNQRFAIELVGVPTAGYVWAPAQMPAFVQRAGEASGNMSQQQSQPGFTGGNHWEVTMFVATQAGEGEIVMEQRRPWETNEPPVDVFRVTVMAR
jgi:predicted secreted protein